MNSIQLLTEVKTTARTYANTPIYDLESWWKARTAVQTLRNQISDDMSSLLHSKEFEDRGDLLAKYRALRNLYEMLAL